MILEGYQNKSEDIYAGYSPSMREATEKKMRKGLLWDSNTGQKKMVHFQGFNRVKTASLATLNSDPAFSFPHIEL